MMKYCLFKCIVRSTQIYVILNLDLHFCIVLNRMKKVIMYVDEIKHIWFYHTLCNAKSFEKKEKTEQSLLLRYVI